MNRRELLVASAASALGVGGCVGRLGPPDGGDTPDNSVPGCAQKEVWERTITTSSDDPDPGSIADRRDCTTASRPEPTGDVCATYEGEGHDGEEISIHSPGVASYPSPPSTVDAEALQSFVSAYERAYTQNSAVSRHGRNVVEFSFETHQTETLDRDDSIGVVVIEFGYGYRIRREQDSDSYTDAFGEFAVYGVDETGVVRVPADSPQGGQIEPDAVPDPVEDGELLECF